MREEFILIPQKTLAPSAPSFNSVERGETQPQPIESHAPRASLEDPPPSYSVAQRIKPRQHWRKVF